MTTKRPPPLTPYTFYSVTLVILDLLWVLFLILPSLIFSLVKSLFVRPKKNIKGKIALITGAGNGLGKEIALQLSNQGCTVICVDVKEEDNKKTVSEIIQKKGSGRAYYCDVSNPSEIKALSEIVLDEFGKIDILINNAGLIFANSVLTGSNEEIIRVVNVNFLSNIWMVRAFLPSMIGNEEGHIVSIASASGIHPLAQGNIYSSTKFALVGMTYSLIEEFRKNKNCKNIKVSCAMPYFINTNKMYSQHWRLRFPPLSTKKAATLVIEGMRREFKFYTVPWIDYGYHLSSLLRFLPTNLYHLLRDKFYADFTFENVIETKL